MADDEVCPECKGTQWKQLGDKAQPCICLKRQRLSGFLGPDLAGATKITEGPLYALDGHLNSVTRDRTTENLFIKATWPALLPHLRLAMGHRHYSDPSFRFGILTDERIVNVYVGNERYSSRSKAKRDDQDTFNGLKDLVEGPSLLIVRLGFLGHKNIAAPGALKQSLMIREVAGDPTWVVQNPQGDYPISWNEEVAAYIAEYFDVVDLRKLPTPQSYEAAPTMEVEEHGTKTARTAEPTTPSELMPTVDDDPMGVTRTGSRKPGYKKPWKKRRDDNDGGGGGDMPPV